MDEDIPPKKWQVFSAGIGNFVSQSYSNCTFPKFINFEDKKNIPGDYKFNSVEFTEFVHSQLDILFKYFFLVRTNVNFLPKKYHKIFEDDRANNFSTPRQKNLIKDLGFYLLNDTTIDFCRLLGTSGSKIEPRETHSIIEAAWRLKDNFTNPKTVSLFIEYCGISDGSTYFTGEEKEGRTSRSAANRADRKNDISPVVKDKYTLHTFGEIDEKISNIRAKKIPTKGKGGKNSTTHLIYENNKLSSMYSEHKFLYSYMYGMDKKKDKKGKIDLNYDYTYTKGTIYVTRIQQEKVVSSEHSYKEASLKDFFFHAFIWNKISEYTNRNYPWNCRGASELIMASLWSIPYLDRNEVDHSLLAEDVNARVTLISRNAHYRNTLMPLAQYGRITYMQDDKKAIANRDSDTTFKEIPIVKYLYSQNIANITLSPTPENKKKVDDIYSQLFFIPFPVEKKSVEQKLGKIKEVIASFPPQIRRYIYPSLDSLAEMDTSGVSSLDFSSFSISDDEKEEKKSSRKVIDLLSNSDDEEDE